MKQLFYLLLGVFIALPIAAQTDTLKNAAEITFEEISHDFGLIPYEG